MCKEFGTKPKLMSFKNLKCNVFVSIFGRKQLILKRPLKNLVTVP